MTRFFVIPGLRGRAVDVLFEIPLVRLGVVHYGSIDPKNNSLTAFLQLSLLPKQRNLPHSTLQVKKSRETSYNWLKVTPLASNKAET